MKERMIIVYHTNLSGNRSAGPTYSVPKQIKAQSDLDDVLWVNTINVKVPEWEDTGLFHSTSEYNFQSLEDLPHPFNKPDIVVFESFYQKTDEVLAKELRKKRIPYVIVPRGALTNEAQHLKRVKKLLGNTLFFNSFAKHAASMQYLTKKEKEDSGKKWNKNTVVIPNGITIPNVMKTQFSEDKIIFSFIGRIAIRHKGLDLLIDAIDMSARILREKKCVFNLYGPDDGRAVERLNEMIDERHLTDLISIHPEIHGKEKEKVLLNTDVFVLTSRFEGHPMGLIEALSYGIPALVTTGSNMRKEIEDYAAGWGGDCSAEAIKNLLIDIINNIEDIKKAGKNARLLAECYKWENISKYSHSFFCSLFN